MNITLILKNIGLNFPDLKRREVPVGGQRPYAGWIPSLLCAFEKLSFGSPIVQRWLVNQHIMAFEKLRIQKLENPSICIVGGGLFPRTYLAMEKIFPVSNITIVDSSRENLLVAQKFNLKRTTLIQEAFSKEDHLNFRITIIPLAFVGNKAALYRQRKPYPINEQLKTTNQNDPKKILLIHDWIWNIEGNRTAIVSWWLLKRINLVEL